MCIPLVILPTREVTEYFECLNYFGNTSALAALAKGYSGVPDSAHLVHIFHAWAACAGVSVWFEYVPTDSNPADEPSRELALAVARWRLEAGPVSAPVPCRQPPLARLGESGAWAREAASVRRALVSRGLAS